MPRFCLFWKGEVEAGCIQSPLISQEAASGDVAVSASRSGLCSSLPNWYLLPKPGPPPRSPFGLITKHRLALQPTDEHTFNACTLFPRSLFFSSSVHAQIITWKTGKEPVTPEVWRDEEPGCFFFTLNVLRFVEFQTQHGYSLNRNILDKSTTD